MFKRQSRLGRQVPRTTATGSSLENKPLGNVSLERGLAKKNVALSANRMDKYKLLHEIGQGSYASVRLAERKDGSLVAIKMYDKLKLLDPQRK